MERIDTGLTLLAHMHGAGTNIESLARAEESFEWAIVSLSPAQFRRATRMNPLLSDGLELGVFTKEEFAQLSRILR